MYKTVFDSHNMHVVLFVSHHSLLKTAVSEPMVMTVLFVATLAMSSKKEEADNVQSFPVWCLQRQTASRCFTALAIIHPNIYEWCVNNMWWKDGSVTALGSFTVFYVD